MSLPRTSRACTLLWKADKPPSLRDDKQPHTKELKKLEVARRLSLADHKGRILLFRRHHFELELGRLPFCIAPRSVASCAEPGSAVLAASGIALVGATLHGQGRQGRASAMG